MSTNIKYTFIILLSITTIFACKTEEKKVDYTGKQISEIRSSDIILDDGTIIALQEDSIAKIFYLVRHAEKDTSIKVEPPLSPEGIIRSSKIADIMRGTRVDAIYSTLTLRTMYTVDSLADIKAMAIKPYDNKELKILLEDIKTSDEYNRIFVVGHSNTIPSITNTLAERDIFTKTFDESDYGNFVIVVVKKSGVKDVYQLKY